VLRWVWNKKPEKVTADREADRYDVSVQVKSRQLPSFRALTLDISGAGLQLESQGLLEKGQIIVLELEFDREELPDFSCPAEVMWAKKDDMRRQYLAGLAFRPSDDEARLNLARMDAVLETRSEADVQSLLPELYRPDSEREAFFLQKRDEAASPPSARYSAPPAPSLPYGSHYSSSSRPYVSASYGPSPPRVAAPRFDPPPPLDDSGVLIPLEIRINGYHWDRSGGYLVVLYAEGRKNYELLFPDCQVCLDNGCGVSQLTIGLHATTESERLANLLAERGDFPWKHYRFLSLDGPFLDIISRSCQVSE
jgi:hypothetical protein